MPSEEIVPQQDPNTPSVWPTPGVQLPREAPSPLPATPAIKKQTYSSAMSYIGSTRRTVAWAKRVGAWSTALAIAAWTFGLLFLVFMHTFLLAWYLVVFGLFGLFLFPFRLITRGQHKNHHLQAAQLATMQAMLQQQQSATRKGPPGQGPE